MRQVRSALFALIFYGATVIAVTLAIAAAPFGRKALGAVARGWVLFHRWCAAAILGIRSRIEGEVPTGAVLVAAKHQSMYETLELVAVLGRPVPVLKRELADIPGFGWAARRYGVIPVDRSGGAPALRRMMAAAAAAKADGRQILIFPEGTRVAPGEQPPLQPGFAGLYRTLRLPVVPVAVDSGRLSPRQSFIKLPGVVTLRFGAPIPCGLDRRDIEAQVHAAINRLDT
jgi:1-acyl-sn-glycerol-3-phosphate acyltransferase